MNETPCKRPHAISTQRYTFAKNAQDPSFGQLDVKNEYIDQFFAI